MVFTASHRHVVSAALFASMALVAFACSGGDDATPTADDGAAEPAVATTGTGTFIFEGARFDPPFDVQASGREVSVNGTTVVTLGGVVPDAPDLNAPIESAFGLADHAAEAYEAAGGGLSALEAARDAIANEPLLASAIVNTDAGELAITDTSGLQVFFIPEPPDGAARARSDGELAADAAELAASWSAILGEGGLILVPSEGPTLAATAGAAAELVSQINEAMALGGSEREARLLELLTHADLVAELIDRYEPAAEVRSRTRAPTENAEPSHHPIGLVGSDSPAGGGPGQAGGGISQTPGKPEAYIYTTLPDDGDAAAFFRILGLEGYKVWVFQARQTAFNGRGWENFISTSGTGALYLATHGAPRGVSVESFPNNASAAAVHQRLVGTEAGNFYWWREGNGTWWLAITVQGLQRHWQSNNSIVHAAICNSNTLNAGFRAREFFAYQPTTTCAIATPDTILLWERMSGLQGEGKLRPASVAFGQGGFSGGFRHTDGSPEDDTVVSPGVAAFSSLELVVGESGFVTIQFDAFLDATVPSKALTRVTGCIQPAAEASYVFDRNQFALVVPVVATEVGDGGVTVIATMTRSPGRIHLDGNQKPEGTTHVAENRDDYVGAVTCVSAGVPLSPTTGIEPPSPSPSPVTDPDEPPVIEIPDSSTGATSTEPGGSVPPGNLLVFYLGGVFYDATGLATIDAHVPFCAYQHVHGGPIQPVRPAGGASASEQLGECGFGPPNFYLIDAP